MSLFLEKNFRREKEISNISFKEGQCDCWDC
jgi:hypothetical protein